ncbi:hypothetical protein SK80_00230 [Escherichia coli]|nr:hypothetical protein SK80_00230 [Escherichia coli]
MFAGKKSAQIREILISESAWEEMTCLFAPSLSNIVLFPIKEDDPRNQVNFLYEPSERPYCHHASVRVDEKERQVRCKICGAVVEPFDWMLSVAKRETRLADDVRLLRQEERERRKNIEKLIQIERNGKAWIRRVTKSKTE